MRKKGAFGLLLAALFLVAACLTPQQREEAKRLALGDERFEELLHDGQFEVVRVRRPTYDSSTEAVVDIRFDHPVPIASWPTDVCDIAEAGDAATGARWLVDLTDDVILAVSPLWGDATCLDV